MEESKNICHVKGEDTIDHSYQMVEETLFGGKNLDDPARSHQP